MNHELPDFQAGFRKGRGTRDQIDNIRWIMEKARVYPTLAGGFFNSGATWEAHEQCGNILP